MPNAACANCGDVAEGPVVVYDGLIYHWPCRPVFYIDRNGLANALRDVLKLIDDQVLVKNTANDDKAIAFIEQGIRIVRVLKAAQDALAADKILKV